MCWKRMPLATCYPACCGRATILIRRNCATIMFNHTETIPDMHRIVGSHDIVLITLDTLRYDVAQALYEAGELPVLGRFLPLGGWERRHSPATFTYAAHQAFFAGFLPTPAAPGRHPRLFASAFAGSETTSKHTWTFAEADLPANVQVCGE